MRRGAAGRGTRNAAAPISTASVACMASSQRFLVANSSTSGPQKNFRIQGTPKKVVSPTASRLTPRSRKKTVETERMMEKGNPSAK